MTIQYRCISDSVLLRYFLSFYLRHFYQNISCSLNVWLLCFRRLDLIWGVSIILFYDENCVWHNFYSPNFSLYIGGCWFDGTVYSSGEKIVIPNCLGEMTCLGQNSYSDITSYGCVHFKYLTEHQCLNSRSLVFVTLRCELSLCTVQLSYYHIYMYYFIFVEEFVLRKRHEKLMVKVRI